MKFKSDIKIQAGVEIGGSTGTNGQVLSSTGTGVAWIDQSTQDLSGYLLNTTVATNTTLGLIKLFNNTDQTVAANAVTTTANRTYGLQLNSSNQAVINVPWTDTNTWRANAVDSDGYVAQGSGQANKVWKTDATGNPAWRTDANTTYTAGTGINLDSGAFRLQGGEIPGSVDLNTYRTTGIFCQNANADAASGSNYPTDSAGILEVYNDDYGNGLFTVQRYSKYNSINVYQRQYYNGTWYSWRDLTQDTNTIPTDFVSAANGGTFSGDIFATNLSGTNTGDQDLSGYLTTTGKAADSDLLDGIDSTGFVKQLGNTTSPDYTTPSSRRVDPNASNPTNEHYAITTFGNNDNVTGQLATHFVSGLPYTRSFNTAWSSWQKIWTDGNDGSDSGLDADLLDGQHASAFLTSYSETDTLATVTARGASTDTAVSLLSGNNVYSGHYYLNPHDSNGNHYPHFNDGANGNGVNVNWRLYEGSNLITHTWNYTDTNFVNSLRSTVDMRAPIFYDSNDTAFYVDPNSTSRFNKIQTSSSGAIPRYDTAFYVIQGQHWYGDTSSQGMYLGESGNDVYLRGQMSIGGTSISAGYALTMGGSINVNNTEVNYVSQLHFNDNVRFYDDGNDSYLNFKYGDATTGGIKFLNGGGTRKGYVFADGTGFGLLDNDGNWAVRTQTGTNPLELYCDNNLEFQVFNSYTLSPGSSRAPIFYDSNDTNYYLNPASTSRLNHGKFVSTLSFGNFTTGSQGTLFEGYSTHSVVRTDSARLDFYMGKTTTGVGTMMSLTDTGNVGIGTTSPTDYKLDVVNTNDGATGIGPFRVSAQANAGTVAVFENTVGINTSLKISDTVDDMYVVSRNGIMGLGASSGWSSNNLNIKSNGYVGIGNRNPSARLHVKGGTMRIDSGNGIDFYDGSALMGSINPFNTILNISSTYKIAFRTGSGQTEKMRLTDDGRLLVNTPDDASATNSRFEVIGTSANTSTNMTFKTNGNLGLGDYSPVAKITVVGSTNPTTSNLIQIKNISNGGSVIDFRNSANTQAGKISMPSSTTVNYGTTSDYRLKTNVVDLENGIEKVKKLKPSRFEWIENGIEVDGFIAHEVAEVVPEAVTGVKDAVDENSNPVYQDLDYSKVIPVLTAALKEAIQKIELLETRIQTLENK